MELPRRILFLADINSVHTERWVELLLKEGVELALFSLSAKQTNWIESLDVPFKTFGLDENVTRSKGQKSKLRYFRALGEIKELIASWKPDIVHAHYATSYGMLASRLKFPQTVVSLWGTDVYEFPRKSILHKLYFKRVVKKATVVCSTSHAMAQEAKKYVSRDYYITPFGTDMQRFAPALREEKKALVIGTVKSLEHVYGIDRLLRVFAAFSKKSKEITELHIYGKGSQEEELIELAESLGITSQCTFHGFVKGEALVKAFQSLDIALVLSRNESFGVAAIEAQACAVPTLVSNVGGLPEVCAHEDFIVDGEDVEGIVALLQSLENEPERIERGEQARKFVVDNYRTEVCVNTFMKAYDIF